MNITPRDKDRGLYHKFRNIERVDGRSAPGEKHHGCNYFVLDITHDPHALVAIRAYAESCALDFPILARDLRLQAAAEANRLMAHLLPNKKT